MALLEFFIFLIYSLTTDIIYQPLSRIRTDGGVVFYGITSVGDPPQQVVTFFEFDQPTARYRNYPNVQAFNDMFMVDDLFGQVNEFKVANQKFSLPFLFDPYYLPFTHCGDIPCQLSIGMGKGSPFWDRYENISYGHLGLTLDEYTAESVGAFANAFACEFASVSLCDVDVSITNLKDNSMPGDHITMRFGLHNDPVTYFPEDLFYAIKGTLTPKGTQLEDWPSLEICDYSGHCFTMPNYNILMSRGGFTEMTIRPWTNDYILVGTSFVENIQVYFFSRQNAVGFYVHPTTLNISAWGMAMAVLSAFLLAYIVTTSFNINVGVQNQITGIKFRVIMDLTIITLIPLVILYFNSYGIMLYHYAPSMMVFVATTYLIMLILYIVSYVDIIMGRLYPTPQTITERVDKAGTALVRNLTACTAATFNIFCTFLEVYPGGEVEIFQFLFLFFYTTFVFFLLLNVLWFLFRLRNLKWAFIAILVAAVFCTSNVAGTLMIAYPYITLNFGNNRNVRYIIILMMMVFQIIIAFIGSILLHVPYFYYIRTGQLPKLHDG